MLYYFLFQGLPVRGSLPVMFAKLKKKIQDEGGPDGERTFGPGLASPIKRESMGGYRIFLLITLPNKACYSDDH